MRLNLGCGGQIAEGWCNVDRAFPDGVDEDRYEIVPLDIRKAWIWRDGVVDGIVIHHVADLLTVDELDDVLRKCHRVLAPGGVLRVSCADITRGIERAMAGDMSWCAEPKWTSDFGIEDYDKHAANNGLWMSPEATLGNFILQGGARKQFIPSLLMQLKCTAAGFHATLPCECQRTRFDKPWITELDSRPDESWFVEAVK